MFFKSPPRSAATTIDCEKCKHTLNAERTCHEVYLKCPFCKTKYTVAECASKMDDILEDFIENQYSDRV